MVPGNKWVAIPFIGVDLCPPCVLLDFKNVGFLGISGLIGDMSDGKAGGSLRNKK